MAKSQQTYNKKENEKKRLKKRLDKQKKREERKENSETAGFDDMIAYVDENGHFTDTPPDRTKKKGVDLESIEISVPKRPKEDIITTRQGRVDFFNDSKGFGFIKELDSNERYFVHVNGLLDDVSENDLVTFELEQGLKGLNAVRVKKV
jgi:cold shock CspA family protein